MKKKIIAMLTATMCLASNSLCFSSVAIAANSLNSNDIAEVKITSSDLKECNLVTESKNDGCWINFDLVSGAFAMFGNHQSFSIIGSFERKDNDLYLYPENASAEFYVLHREEDHFVSQSDEIGVQLKAGLVFYADNDAFWENLLDWICPGTELTEKETSTATTAPIATTSISTTTTVSNEPVPIETEPAGHYESQYEIIIDDMPDKLVYSIGENLDLTGLRVSLFLYDQQGKKNVVYQDVDPLEYTDAFIVDTNFNNDKVGTYSIGIMTTDHYKAFLETKVQKFTVTVKNQMDMMGDVNDDGAFNVSDVVLLQKWLLAVPDTHLANWKAADFCEDNKLDVFDLMLMKRSLIYGSISQSTIELKTQFPEYYGLPTTKGLEVYLWQETEGNYKCGLLMGTNRNKTDEEIVALTNNGTTIEEMKEILSSYCINNDMIAIIPIRISEASYEIVDSDFDSVRKLFWGNDEDEPVSIAGKIFVYEKSADPGIYDDLCDLSFGSNGTYVYHIGYYTSSNQDQGTWEISGDTLVLTGQYGTNKFRYEDKALIYIAEESDGFSEFNDKSTPKDGEKFILAPERTYDVQTKSMNDVTVSIKSALRPHMSDLSGIGILLDVKSNDYPVTLKATDGNFVEWDIEKGSGPVKTVGKEYDIGKNGYIFWNPDKLYYQDGFESEIQVIGVSGDVFIDVGKIYVSQVKGGIFEASFEKPSPSASTDNSVIAGKIFAYEKEGAGGYCTLSFNENGRFLYSPGKLSSYMDGGDWKIDGDTVSLIGMENRTIYLKITDDTLVYIAEGSDEFPYMDINDGEKFVIYRPEISADKFQLNSRYSEYGLGDPKVELDLIVSELPEFCYVEDVRLYDEDDNFIGMMSPAMDADIWNYLVDCHVTEECSKTYYTLTKLRCGEKSYLDDVRSEITVNFKVAPAP